MSGDYARFNAAARTLLEADVGPIEDPSASCGVGPCEDHAVYRVPWPQFGGDIDYCPYHLARYRAANPKLWTRVQEHVDDDLSEFATRGDRFLSIADVPSKIRNGRFRRVGLTELGYALYEQAEPDENGLVTHILVSRTLGYKDALQVPSDRAGEFLQQFHTERGIYEWDAAARDALYGSGGERR